MGEGGLMRLQLSGVSGIFVAIAILSTSLSCSKELSRSQAVALIRQSAEYKTGWRLPLKDGLDCEKPLGNMSVPEAEKQDLQEYEWLKQHGYVAAFQVLPVNTIFGPCGNWNYQFGVPGFRVYLSEQSKNLPKGTDANVYLLTIADKQITDVTGIAQAQAPTGESLRKVEFTWKWVPNDTGRAFFRDILPDRQKVWDETMKGQATLQLYDDGFRVKEVKF
jgi:hypothetical protein